MTRPEFIRKAQIGFAIALSFESAHPAAAYGQSRFIDDVYSDILLPRGWRNPWHLGWFHDAPGTTADGDPEMIQSEVELISLMFGLVLQLKPKLVVETGSHIGAMTRALAAACWVNGFGRVISSDIRQDMVDYATTLCSGLPAEIRHCPALDLPELRLADLVFIDSGYESRSSEINEIKPGAVYVYHDSLAEPWIRSDMAGEEFQVHFDSPRGFSVVRKK